MWLWCKMKKNMPKIQVLFWNVINKIIFRLNKVTFEKGLQTRGKIYIYNGDLAEIHLGEDVCLNSADWANPIGSGNHIWIQMVGKEAVLSIGNRTGISNVAITCASKVEIGNDVLIGSGTKIYDTDFHALSWKLRKNGGKAKCAPIKIGDGVFIGAGCMILKGVTIGEGSIIGAGAVVTRSVPAGQVWAGNPARYIRDI